MSRQNNRRNSNNASDVKEKPAINNNPRPDWLPLLPKLPLQSSDWPPSHSPSPPPSSNHKKLTLPTLDGKRGGRWTPSCQSHWSLQPPPLPPWSSSDSFDFLHKGEISLTLYSVMSESKSNLKRTSILRGKSPMWSQKIWIWLQMLQKFKW